MDGQALLNSPFPYCDGLNKCGPDRLLYLNMFGFQLIDCFKRIMRCGPVKGR